MNDTFLERLRDDPIVRILADANPSFMSYVDADYRYQFCNRAYEEFFGKRREDVIGRTVSELWGQKAEELMKQYEISSAGETVTFETDTLVSGRHLVATLVPDVAPDGTVRGTWVFSNEATEVHNARAAVIEAQRMASLGRLVTGLLHELNTPLGVVRGSAKTLLKAYSMKNAERAQRVVADSSEVIEAAVARLSELLERLRSFAAIDEAPVKSCQPSELVDNVLALLSHAIGSDVEVVRSYQPVPGLVAHSAKLSQIFMTLLLNAIDAVDGRGRIEVGCCAHEDRIEVTIADDGRGMSEDQLLTLFEPTFSSGERTKAGFGLWVAQIIAHDHGGEIRVESTLGEGALFTVSLPSTPPPSPR